MWPKGEPGNDPYHEGNHRPGRMDNRGAAREMAQNSRLPDLPPPDRFMLNESIFGTLSV